MRMCAAAGNMGSTVGSFFCLSTAGHEYDRWTNYGMCLAMALVSLSDGVALHAVNRSREIKVSRLLSMRVNASEGADPNVKLSTFHRIERFWVPLDLR
jgi:hypothetical protein